MNRDETGRKWPWVLGVLLALLAIWLVADLGQWTAPPEPRDPAMERIGPREPDDRGTPTAPAEPVTGAAAEQIVARQEEMRAAVRRYEAGCSSRLEPVAGPGIGDLFAECTARLRGAVDAVVAGDTVGSVAIDERLDEYRERVALLRETPPGEGRADPAREVMRSAAEVLAMVAEERYPETIDRDDAVHRLRSAADALNPDRPLERQQERIQRFFLAAGGLLSSMARPDDPGTVPEPSSNR